MIPKKYQWLVQEYLGHNQASGVVTAINSGTLTICMFTSLSLRYLLCSSIFSRRLTYGMCAVCHSVCLKAFI